MKTAFPRLLLLIASFALCGCFPEERIWWSPKGDRALVSINGQLHMVTPDGTPGEALLAGVAPEKTRIQWVSWLADGSGFVTGEERTVKAWAELRKLIPSDEVDMVEQMVPAVIPFIEAASKLPGDLSSISALAGSIKSARNKRVEAAVFAALDKDSPAVKAKLLTLPKGQEILDQLNAADAGLALSELCLYKLAAGQKAERVPLISSLLKPLGFPKASPKHDAVSFLQLEEDEEAIHLKVLSLKSRTTLDASSRISAAYDWTPDGRTLIFAAPLGVKDEKLQSISRLTVLQDNGDLMKPATEKQADGSTKSMEGPDRLGSAVSMITAILLDHTALHVLPDGRVLFACPSITLPTVSTDQEVDQHLYLIAADGKSVRLVPTTPGDLPADPGFFDVSPDGKFAAIVESETDVVAVVELDTGKTRIISPKHPLWKCQTLPAWKSASELTFAALDASNRPAWMLWTESTGVRSVSKQWPANATESWLKEEKPAEKPAAKSDK